MNRRVQHIGRPDHRAIARCLIAVAAAALCLAGCSGFAGRPPEMQVELESTPSGAEARLSTGQSCMTPCSVSMSVPTNDFSVSFTLNEFQPMTIPVRVSGNPAGFMSPGTSRIEPNPVVAQLQPVAPPPKPPPPKRAKRKPAAAQ